MCPVFISQCLEITVVWEPFQSPLHSSNIFAGIPQNVIFRSDTNHLPVNTFYFNRFFFGDGMTTFRFIKHLSSCDQNTARFGLFFNFFSNTPDVCKHKANTAKVFPPMTRRIHDLLVAREHRPHRPYNILP